MIRVRHLERAIPIALSADCRQGLNIRSKTAAATCTLKFNGNVTKQGKYTSKLVYEDELGKQNSV